VIWRRRLGEYLDIRGPVVPGLFETALRQVVAETDALRKKVPPEQTGNERMKVLR
jgi:nonribosomal peptide synthetase DhbF